MKETRIKKMMDYIIKNETASLKELSDYFGVSIFTVRRDVNQLVNEGVVKKKYGGVTVTQPNNKSLAYTSRAMVNQEDKQLIAKQAARLIQDGEIIYIDGGTTTSFMPAYVQSQDITVVTNNIVVMNQLLNMPTIDLIFLGGSVRKETQSTCGISAIEQIKLINFDKAFISCTGISSSFDLTNYTAIDAELKKIAIRNSEQQYVLADQSKLRKASLVTFGHLSTITGLITAKQLLSGYKDYCQLHDVKCFEVQNE